ncbi:Wzz/FepE/Etk N-terminal domain-containing protein [Staphylococcus massiliensis]|uniref:Capsular polysaccharide synthesis enzyme CapA n=1 Tax=Staphylococcus massiliensis S46 TaxID=1229783 RepID=K9B5A1_9STAP|nr:Wzz/FepE/Etk N-terminal domain-containing protein [Staphylococcus massiliensis]EKU49997.1 capsular polysaccharide synthesis enzyme CapA [Staphylococcus massiliensis S46]MCG3402293.1 capsule biosynthesis protein CapA [Staphylococcus massiliensis]MCG3411737.1 capsule biosynthesis protein CapA [Staphylococcus massiliensis]POA00557.1 capsule biosynthesis protein CapA [Staphylococcus massiliensis CCUG 55927]
MENTIDLTKLFALLKKNLKLLIIIPLVTLLLGLLLTVFVMKPKYEASTQILVAQNETSEEFKFQEVQSNLQLVNTYSEIIKSPRILQEVSKKHKSYDQEEIASMLNVSNSAESQVLNITVKSGDRKDSEQLANTIAKVFTKEVPNIMNVNNVTVLSKADEADKVSPRIMVNTAISLIIGLIIASIYILLNALFDKRLKSEEEIESYLDIPVLGVIQKFK